jgi:hypothetical protein
MLDTAGFIPAVRQLRPNCDPDFLKETAGFIPAESQLRPLWQVEADSSTGVKPVVSISVGSGGRLKLTPPQA